MVEKKIYNFDRNGEVRLEWNGGGKQVRKVNANRVTNID